MMATPCCAFGRRGSARPIWKSPRGTWGSKAFSVTKFVGDVISSPEKNIVGQRVVGEINIVCGRCDMCLSGLSTHCRQRSVLGILNHDGAFADYVRLPAVNLHAVPASVDDDQAVFVEPLAAAFQVTKQLGPQGRSGAVEGRRWITVLGDGRLGLLVAQVLRNAGYPVRMVGRHADKLAICEKWSIRSRLLADISPRHDSGCRGGLHWISGQSVRAGHANGPPARHHRFEKHGGRGKSGQSRAIGDRRNHRQHR